MSNITEKVKTLGTKVKNSIKDGASNFVSNVKEDPIEFAGTVGGLICTVAWAAIVYKVFKENAALKHSLDNTEYMYIYMDHAMDGMQVEETKEIDSPIN